MCRTVEGVIYDVAGQGIRCFWYVLFLGAGNYLWIVCATGEQVQMDGTEPCKCREDLPKSTSATILTPDMRI